MLHNFERCLEKQPEYETDNLKVLYYDLDKNYTATYKSYEYNRICTILSGKKHVTINGGQQFVYTPTDFILLPPNSSVQMEIRENTKAVVYEISDQLIDEVTDRIQTGLDIDLLSEDKDQIAPHQIHTIESSLKKINQIFTENNPDKGFLIELSSKELVYNLLKNNYVAPKYNENLQDPVRFTIHFIQTHIHAMVSIQEIANQLNLSLSSLSNRFKKTTGFTPVEYMNLVKLKKAREELHTKSVTEVCFELGYENISYFIHLFKKHYGETPKQYSMRILKQ